MINLEMIEIITPALIAGVFISLLHGLLGLRVLKRGIIFIDLAIAQIAGLGLITGNLIWPDSHLLSQMSAITFALLASLFFYNIEKKSPALQEAIIGSCFILSSSLCILLLSHHAHGTEEIENLMSGQILLVTFADIYKHIPLYIILLTIYLIVPHARKGIGFYVIFALAITSSVQLVGVYVVFASLILPAIAARKSKKPILTAWLCGIISVISGIVISLLSDLPTGPVIVISYVSVTILSKMILRR